MSEAAFSSRCPETGMAHVGPRPGATCPRPRGAARLPLPVAAALRGAGLSSCSRDLKTHGAHSVYSVASDRRSWPAPVLEHPSYVLNEPCNLGCYSFVRHPKGAESRSLGFSASHSCLVGLGKKAALWLLS